MAKKIKFEGELVEQTKHYKVLKRKDGEFCILSRYDDTVYHADNYKLIGYAVLKEYNGSKQYWNMKNWQLHGQGKSTCYAMLIDSWETETVDGKEETSIKYHNERGNKFVRFIDEEGNLYKKNKAKKVEQEEALSL